jgi:hypothetical protein
MATEVLQNPETIGNQSPIIQGETPKKRPGRPKTPTEPREAILAALLREAKKGNVQAARFYDEMDRATAKVDLTPRLSDRVQRLLADREARLREAELDDLYIVEVPA